MKQFFIIDHLLETNKVEHIQEYYRERFYGGITILALNATLIASENTFSALGVFVTIIITILSLYLASILSALMSYRVTNTSSRDKLITILYTHRGLLLAGVPTLIFLALSIIGFIDLYFALVGAIIVGAIRMIVTVINAYDGHRHYTWIVMISIVLQLSVLGVIIALKLLAK